MASSIHNVRVATAWGFAFMVTMATSARSQTSVLPYDSATAISLGQTPGPPAVSDVDNDGHLDIVVALGTSSIAVLRGTGTGSFAAAQIYPLGMQGYRVAVGRFNADAWDDVAVVSFTSPKVRVLLGTGGGALGAATAFNLPGHASDIAAADVDGDGITDLVALVDNSTIQTLKGNGSGSFAALASSPLPLSGSRFALGRIDADADLDIAVVRPNGSSLYVRMGNNAGAFLGGVDLATADYPSDVVLGDFNGDAKLDLASLRLITSQVALQLGNGLGGFGAATLAAAPLDLGFLAATDFDGDSLLDVIAAGDTGFAFFKGTGTSFAAPSIFACGSATGLALGDFDGNGQADAAISDSVASPTASGDEVRILLGDGNAGFVAPPVLPITDSVAGFFAVGDVDGDGDIDLISRAPWPPTVGISVALGDAAGGFAPPLSFAQTTGPTLMAAGDINGDLRADVAYSTPYGSLNGIPATIQLSNALPGPSFSPSTTLISVVGADVRDLTLADLDTDGDLDLVTLWSAPPNLLTFINTGNGSFSAPTGMNVASYPGGLETGDVDGDAYRDLVIVDASGAWNVFVLRGTGGGNFATPIALSLSGFGQSAALGDLDGDGLDEVIAASYPALEVFRNLGGGSFGAPTLYPRTALKGRCTTADINGDGRLDVLVPNTEDDSLEVRFGDGLGALSGANGLIITAYGRRAFAEDLNLDGKLDLVAGTGRSGEVAVLVNNGKSNAVPYCTAGTTTHGCVPSISGSGVPSASLASGFSINIANVEGQKFGIIFYGIDNTGFSATPWSFGSTSWLCVKGPFQRSPPQSSLGSANQCNGSMFLDWNAYFATHAGSLGHPFTPGLTVFAQGWFRDPPAPKTTNLSNALAFVLSP